MLVFTAVSLQCFLSAPFIFITNVVTPPAYSLIGHLLPLQQLAVRVSSLSFLDSVRHVPSDLTAIPANAFRGLSNLTEIELSHGKIQTLDTESFSGTFLVVTTCRLAF